MLVFAIVGSFAVFDEVPARFVTADEVLSGVLTVFDASFWYESNCKVKKFKSHLIIIKNAITDCFLIYFPCMSLALFIPEFFEIFCFSGSI